jgi:hypothetical protein
MLMLRRLEQARGSAPGHAATPIVTVFLCSVERRFSVPAVFSSAVVHSLGQNWPQAIGEAGAQR